MEYGVALIFLFIGFIFGKLVMNQSAKNYDINLLILAFVFLIMGSKKVEPVDIVQFVLLNVLPPFLSGVVTRRYMNNHMNKRGNN